MANPFFLKNKSKQPLINVKRPFRKVIITNVNIMTKIPDVKCFKNSALKICELRINFWYNFYVKGSYRKSLLSKGFSGFVYIFQIQGILPLDSQKKQKITGTE